jgi:hypothetical protein
MIKPWITAAAIVVAASSLHAAEPVTPTDKTNVVAFSAGNDRSDVEYRRLFLNSRLAVIVLAGYHGSSSKSSGSVDFQSSQHSTEFGLGLRHNFATIEQVRPFVQLTAAREHTSGSDCTGATAFSYAATGGGEYFVGRRVSFEGSAGVQVGHDRSGCFLSNGVPESRIHTSFVDTFRTAVGINFYF